MACDCRALWDLTRQGGQYNTCVKHRVVHKFVSLPSDSYHSLNIRMCLLLDLPTANVCFKFDAYFHVQVLLKHSTKTWNSSHYSETPYWHLLALSSNNYHFRMNKLSISILAKLTEPFSLRFLRYSPYLTLEPNSKKSCWHVLGTLNFSKIFYIWKMKVRQLQDIRILAQMECCKLVLSAGWPIKTTTEVLFSIRAALAWELWK